MKLQFQNRKECERVFEEKRVKKKLLCHDEATYEELIDKYSRLLWVIASGILSDLNGDSRMDVEEVVSDVFVRLWNEPEKFDPKKATLKTYLSVMTRSIALNRRRKLIGKYESQIEESVVYEQESIEEQNVINYQLKAVYDIIQGMEQPTKEILLRRLFLEEKPMQISEVMEISPKEVDNRLYRGKKQLREELTRRQWQ